MKNRKSRLRLYLEQSRSYKIFIGYPLHHPVEWVEITFSKKSLMTRDGEAVPIDQVSSFILAYPSGEILDMEGDLESLPESIYFIEPEPVPVIDRLDSESLKKGEAFLEIAHTTNKPHVKRENYSTTLRNISKERIRVIRFAGYTKKGSEYVLNTITGGFFTEEQFKNWYGVDSDGWIKPNQVVMDLNNYGRGPGYWVYFCITDAGSEFTAGIPMPKQNLFKLLPR